MRLLAERETRLRSHLQRDGQQGAGSRAALGTGARVEHFGGHFQADFQRISALAGCDGSECDQLPWVEKHLHTVNYLKLPRWIWQNALDRHEFILATSQKSNARAPDVGLKHWFAGNIRQGNRDARRLYSGRGKCRADRCLTEQIFEQSLEWFSQFFRNPFHNCR